MATVIELLVDTLIEAGIKYIFGFPGGVSPFLLEECYKREELEVIIPRHEGAAAVMADMHARLTNTPGVMIGQGVWTATNGGFGLVESYYAGIPLVVITEFSDWFGVNKQAVYQSGTGEYGTVDIENMFRSMAKYVTAANTPEELIYGLQLAIKHATTGRPGPAVVISRWNTMFSSIGDLDLVDPPIYPLQGLLNVKGPTISREDANLIAKQLIAAENPVIICGRGCYAAQAEDELKTLVDLLGIPVATSYMGKGILPETDPFSLGVMGSIGQKLANEQIQTADLLLVLGSCLAPDNTMSCKRDFISCKDQTVIQIDIESRNIAWTYPVTHGFTAHAKFALQEIIAQIQEISPKIDVKQRRGDLETIKAKEETEWFTSKMFFKDKEPIEPERVVKALNQLVKPEDLVVLDGGNNRMWFTKLFQTQRVGQLIGPGGAAGMGWSSSAAISAGLLQKEGNVIGIIGDGGLLMTLYNLETLKQLDLPVKIVVLNNACLGNVRDYLSRKGRKICEYPETNFAEIAKTMGLKSLRIEKLADLEPRLEEALKLPGPGLIEIVVKASSHMRLKNKE